MTTREAIKALHRRGYSRRRIARELGVHRNTVAAWLEGGRGTGGPECTNSTAGSDGTGGEAGAAKCTIPTAGSGGASDEAAGAKCTDSTAGSGPAGKAAGRGRPSECEVHRQFIEERLALGLDATRIWRDLAEERGFVHSYESVKRFVARLKAKAPQRVWRMECEPGEEAQADYGTVWQRIGGKRRKLHVLRVVLSHSRKGYTEAMPRQDTESFIRGLENALRAFGGVPRMLVIDNLKAGVLRADFFDPDINPKFGAFCRHYGVTVMPARPRKPQHKGKVESGVGYVQGSALKGRDFESHAAVNIHLRAWERQVADTRVHGTTRKQVGAHFEAVEKPALQALPPDLFPSFREEKRTVHRDAHVEFDRAYYAVPPEHIGREVWVRCDGRLVQVFNLRMEPLAVHARLEAGRFSKPLGCAGAPKSVRESLLYWQGRAAAIGPETGLWAKAVAAARQEAALRPLMALVQHLAPRHGREALERACARARLHGRHRLRDLKSWLEQPDAQQSFGFLGEHELIRDPAHYGRLVGFEQGN